MVFFFVRSFVRRFDRPGLIIGINFGGNLFSRGSFGVECIDAAYLLHFSAIDCCCFRKNSLTATNEWD